MLLLCFQKPAIPNPDSGAGDCWTASVAGSGRDKKRVLHPLSRLVDWTWSNGENRGWLTGHGRMVKTGDFEFTNEHYNTIMEYYKSSKYKMGV
jgi:hypothetical protein